MKSREHEGPSTRKRDADTRGDAARRTCLDCGRMFASAHRGNRRCKRCAHGLAGDGPNFAQLDVVVHGLGG